MRFTIKYVSCKSSSKMNSKSESGFNFFFLFSGQNTFDLKSTFLYQTIYYILIKNKL